MVVLFLLPKHTRLDFRGGIVGNYVEPYVRKGEKKKKTKGQMVLWKFYILRRLVFHKLHQPKPPGITVKPNISNAKPDDGETLLNVRT